MQINNCYRVGITHHFRTGQTTIIFSEDDASLTFILQAILGDHEVMTVLVCLSPCFGLREKGNYRPKRNPEKETHAFCKTTNTILHKDIFYLTLFHIYMNVTSV